MKDVLVRHVSSSGLDLVDSGADENLIDRYLLEQTDIDMKTITAKKASALNGLLISHVKQEKVPNPQKLSGNHQ